MEEEPHKAGLAKLCWLLFHLPFTRRVGLDENRAYDGMALRGRFLYEYSELRIPARVSNPFVTDEVCNWLEMLVRLAEDLDYLYDCGVPQMFEEMVCNAGLQIVLWNDDEVTPADEEYVEGVMEDINANRIGPNGDGGLFPLRGRDHLDQREVEIWSQSNAYFNEKLEGILWTSTD